MFIINNFLLFISLICINLILTQNYFCPGYLFLKKKRYFCIEIHSNSIFSAQLYG